MPAILIDFLLENLKELLISGRADSILVEKNLVEYLFEELNFIQDFLKNSEDQYNEHSEVESLVKTIRFVASRALEHLDSLLVSDLEKKDERIDEHFTHGCGYGYGFDYFSWIRSFVQEIKHIKGKVMALYDKKFPLPSSASGRQRNFITFKQDNEKPLRHSMDV
ncbi:unnamed protein product [Ilex paraguariensis]|uniref:Disease resistance N-terminal domain-containing protein n=1 Tax=Ilex paraguariensis TaxID=185542 RepID=A0ABC8TL41_9AQUA